MKIAVIGSGGVGGYFGARLARGGSDVVFVARGAHLQAMREHGLQIRSELGDLHLSNVQVTDQIASIGPVDLVIVAVKLWDIMSVAQAIKPLLSSNSAVVSFQNGVQKDDMLRAALGDTAIIGGLCYIAAVIARPGVIVHTGTMQQMLFGEYDGRRSPRVEALLDACRSGGIDADISTDIRLAIWEKFVFLVGLSGTTTSTRKSIGALRENPRTRQFLLETMREAAAVGRALGVPLDAEFAENRMAFFDTLPPAMTSSMHGDLERGNRLELPWLSGGVVELGQSAGVATPVNRTITAVLALYANGIQQA
jgi:2-dehydropantoate 2-reductase